MTEIATRAPRFLRWLHDDQAGYIEIVAGAPFADKPGKIDLVMSTRRWMYLDPERPDLYDAAATYIDQLADHYGNVYTGARLYTRQARNENTRAEAYTKPSRVIFIDDATASPELPYSASIRTSEASRHAYYKCDRHVTKDDARRAAAACGGDPSGVDLTQLVRVPGTFNTKGGACWPVEPEATKNTIYQLDALRSAWPAVACSPKGEITPLAMPAVELHLSNIDAILTCSRSQLIKPDTQTGRILGGEMLIFPARGKMDDSRSMNACAVGLGLLLRGYMDDEIAAVIFHLYRTWGMERDKGTEWCKNDIARILAYAHTQHPEAKQTPTRYRQQTTAAPIVSRPAASRARSDRPRLFDPAMLFARYQAAPELCQQRRKARASALGISTATLDRLEDSLEAIGLIQIEAPKGMPGKVILLGGVINIPEREVLSAPIAAPTPEAPIAHAESEQNADRGPQCIGGTHPPLVAPGPRPRRAAVIAEAFDALDGCNRLTDKRIRQYIEMNYPEVTFLPALLHQLASAERTKRRYAKQDARELEKARALFGEALRKKSRAIAGAAAQMHRTGDKRAPIWDRRAGIYAQVEAERQQQEAERIARMGYSLSEQAEMLDLVDRARPESARQRVGRAAQGHSARVCSPQPAPAGAPAGLVERLRILKAQREAPATDIATGLMG